MPHHGECKPPGGKLVAVDLEVVVGRLAAVRIRGDFFIHPEPSAKPTLDAIAAGLTGAPADLDTPALAARVRAAVPFGVELIGTSPEAVAVAVRRAVGLSDELRAVSREPEDPAVLLTAHRSPLTARHIGSFTADEIDRLTAGWKALPWRLIPERPLPPALNVALDEVLADRVAKGACPPTLRFWRWSGQAVIIGRCQSVANEVDRDAANAMGVQVVRRLTGGGAMFLQPHGAITYSLVLPESAMAGLSIRQSYEVCEAWVIRGLRSLGVDAHHVPINDIACSEGKIGGAAQARRRGVVLHHTTIAYDMDPGEMVKVLRIGREKLRDKATPSAAKRVSPLVRQTGLARDEIVRHLFETFRATFGGDAGEVTAEELAEAERLVAEKYANPTWTHEFA
ncbi:MAG TPA: biotin/lipoate A/B protein ligase family protein [Fimbriiglobus sp.]|nr:biotin/lipoate A/B protein ligase family protein [Fimbriiglobus sp.]